MPQKFFEFEVSGKAVPQARPAASHIGGVYRRFDPPKCREYKAKVRESLYLQCPPKLNGGAVYSGAVAIEVKEFRAMPSSWNKAKRLDALAGRIKPVSKPDTDNILKIVKDALNGVLWKDDAQVVSDKIEKVYAVMPRLKVKVFYLDRLEELEEA